MGEKASSNYAIDLYGTNEGTEEASVDKFEGDIDEFYIADAFGSRKEAYGRRVGGASSSVDNFNQIFQDVMADQKKKARRARRPSSRRCCWTRTSRSGCRSTPPSA